MVKFFSSIRSPCSGSWKERKTPNSSPSEKNNKRAVTWESYLPEEDSLFFFRKAWTHRSPWMGWPEFGHGVSKAGLLGITGKAENREGCVNLNLSSKIWLKSFLQSLRVIVWSGFDFSPGVGQNRISEREEAWRRKLCLRGKEGSMRKWTLGRSWIDIPKRKEFSVSILEKVAFTAPVVEGNRFLSGLWCTRRTLTRLWKTLMRR